MHSSRELDRGGKLQSHTRHSGHAIKPGVANSLRIIFFGTPGFAVPSLSALLAGTDPVVGVVCQPDKPAGRGQHVTAPPVKQVAAAAGLPVLQPEKLRSADVLGALRQWAPDLIVVAAYGKILPAALLALPVHGCVNVHASLLPKYRGAAPIQWAVLRGEEMTGVTIMQINERMDAGDILLQRETRIGDEETYGELQTRLADLGAHALMEAIAHLHAGTLRPQTQREEEVVLAPMIEKEDGRIDWTQSAVTIARRVRAFNPWPSAFTHLDGKLLKIHRAHVGDAVGPSAPGSVVHVDGGIAVATGDGCLILDELQLEGRRRLSAAEFLRGGSIAVGTVLESPPGKERA
jgi:methionyl-tRNA formyltransferase